jgi:beta-fructofuranosidase
MLYYRPRENQFVGDCMPFYHNGIFHLFYLLDEHHHRARSGLGGHQWAHASTTDLRTWEHHPLAIPVEEEWEGSICTGSIIHHNGTFHAFYATRKPDWTQHLSHAASTDGVRFTKTRPLPVLPVPAGYDPRHFRDPFVFQDEAGRFQMLVTTRRSDYPLPERGGCLLRLTSDDLSRWTVEAPLLFPGGGPGQDSIPECPDYFIWNGWHYLVFGLGLATHYRIARSLKGPWCRPRQPLLEGRRLSVLKTAPFGANRRLGAAWIGTRAGDRDTGALEWGGNLVLRELVQHDDGTLSTRFVPELAPSPGRRAGDLTRPLTAGAEASPDAVSLRAPNGEAVAETAPVPPDFHLRCVVRPQRDNARFGLGLRIGENYGSGYVLAFEPGADSVTLVDQVLGGVAEIADAFDLTVICHGDLIDVCIGGMHCMIDRLPERRGDRLFWFCEAGEVAFEEIALLDCSAAAHD